MKTLLAIMIFLSMSQYLDAQIIYVDANNNTGIEDGTQTHPFNTIKEGINAAAPGNQVMISQGTYYPDDSWSGNDHTLLLKAGVSLIGESSDNTIISGIVVDQEASNLSIGLENLRFDEFHFARGTNAGPFTDKNIIRNCATTLINLPFGAGIPVNDTTPGPNYGFQIENNDLGTDGTIEFKQGAGVSELNVVDNICAYIYLKSGGGYTYTIDNNDVQYGIFDKSATNTTTISNNRIYNGTIDDLSGGNQYGIEDEIIENNTITTDENSPAFIDEDYKAGITAKSRSATIRNNTITCTGKVSGIRSSAGAPLHIINNTITLDEVQVPEPDPYEGTIGIFNYSGWGYITGNKIFGGDHGYYSKAGTAEFANNEIENSYTGFYSMGAEVVHNNIIKNCKGDGMILDGLKGPLYRNEVKNNAGAGIRIIRVPIDLGGGADNSPGLNTIQGNGNFDLYIETTSAQNPTVYARFNVWDHDDADLVSQLDIRDGNDSTGLVVVDFTPFSGLGINDQSNYFELNAYPNPFSTSTVIRWQMPVDSRQSAVGSHVILKVYDFIGKEIRTIVDAKMAPGEHQVTFDASGLTAGVYFYQLQTDGIVLTKMMVVYR
jgi:hypothetical protein